MDMSKCSAPLNVSYGDLSRGGVDYVCIFSIYLMAINTLCEGRLFVRLAALVMFRARPQALSRPGQALLSPSRAGPDAGLVRAQGLGFRFFKPKPGPQARASLRPMNLGLTSNFDFKTHVSGQLLLALSQKISAPIKYYN
jgi:hypothetical protein